MINYLVIVQQMSGIDKLVPGTAVDDYLFEPCGYSMNGVHRSVPVGSMKATLVRCNIVNRFIIISYISSFITRNNVENNILKILLSFIYLPNYAYW